MVQKRPRDVVEEDEEEITCKKSATSRPFELESNVGSDEEENEEELEYEDSFIDDGSDLEKEDEAFAFQQRYNGYPQIGEADDDDEDIDEEERRLEEQYARKLWDEIEDVKELEDVDNDSDAEENKEEQEDQDGFINDDPDFKVTEQFTKDSWVRIKYGKYKGDLAQVVNVDDNRQEVTVKLIPRIDYKALVNKIEGMVLEITSKNCPPPRFWSTSKARTSGIPVKTIGDYDYVVGMEGMKFKDGFLYKTLSIKSISSQIQPSLDDLEKMRGAMMNGDDTIDTESLSFSDLLGKNQEESKFREGDRVVVVNGDLINMKGRVLKVDEDFVYFKPINGESEGQPEIVAISSRDLEKLFEPGDHVKIVSGVKEGKTSTILRAYVFSNNKVVNILFDKSTEISMVFADYIQEIPEVTYCQESKPQATNYGYLLTSRSIAKKPDPLLNARVKISQGPNKGMLGTVEEVKGNKIRVYLRAQTGCVYVDRSQIYEYNKMKVVNSIGIQEDHGLGCETPMHYARTPLRPCMTLTRDSLTAAATPIHEAMGTPM